MRNALEDQGADVAVDAAPMPSPQSSPRPSLASSGASAPVEAPLVSKDNAPKRSKPASDDAALFADLDLMFDAADAPALQVDNAELCRTASPDRVRF